MPQIQDRFGWSQASQFADLACHYEIVLVQPLDLVRLQRDGGVTPAETDVGMVALFLSKSADLVDETLRFPKIGELELAAQPAPVVLQLPSRRLGQVVRRFLLRQGEVPPWHGVQTF